MEAEMKASIVDLRYRMNEVLKALDRNEEVEILYHGKPKGILKPHVTPSATRVREHPFFNMRKAKKSVREQMEDLRGGRHRDL
jgi:antitoxin (DNA-binding transcriptional repressor) of toxin-antitoxin stability system